MSSARSRFPTVPGYAWAWLQRSRPVMEEAARRLTGTAATPAFVDGLHEEFATDAFTCAVVVDVIADIAFHGRVPARRPPGAAWDRGLTWWAAALAGTTPAAYAAGAAPAAEQRQLFEARTRPPAPAGGVIPPPAAPPPVSHERRGLAETLRQLVTTAEGGQVPVSALRQLIAHLEGADP